MRKKIGIVTYYNIFNYGSFLQAFALQEKVKQLGYEAEILELSYSRIDNIVNRIRMLIKFVQWPQYIKFILKLRKLGLSSICNIGNITQKKFIDSINEYLNVKTFRYKEIKRIAKGNEYASFICGSDQIWSPLGMIVKKHKFLEFAPEEKRIAYAPSFGVEYIPEYNRRVYQKKLSKIFRISVRENSGKRIIEQLLDRNDIPVVLDPTLLWKREFWDNKEKQIKINGKYMCCYFLNQPERERIEEIQNYAQNKNLNIIVLPYRNTFLENSNSYFVECSPFEFISVIKNAEYILTDSYHGTIFSIQFEKKFIVFERAHAEEVKQTSRLFTLLNIIEMSSHFITTGKWESILNANIDYSRVQSKINDMRKSSLLFLKDALLSVEKDERH